MLWLLRVGKEDIQNTQKQLKRQNASKSDLNTCRSHAERQRTKTLKYHDTEEAAGQAQGRHGVCHPRKRADNLQDL